MAVQAGVTRHVAGTERLAWRALRWLTAWLLTAVMPLVLMLALVEYATDLQLSRRQDRLRDRLQRDLSDLVVESDARNLVRRLGRRIGYALRRGGAAPDGIRRLVRQVGAEWPFETDLYVFDRHGRLCTPGDVRLRSRFLFQRLWSLVRTPSPDQEVYRRHRRQFRALLGTNFQLGALRHRHADVLTLVPKAADAAIYWQAPRRSHRPSGRGPVHSGPARPTAGYRESPGFMLVCWRLPDRLDGLRLLQRRLTTSSRHASGFAPDRPAVLLAPEGGRPFWLGPTPAGEASEPARSLTAPSLAGGPDAPGTGFQPSWDGAGTTLDARCWEELTLEDLGIAVGRRLRRSDLVRLRRTAMVGAGLLGLLSAIGWFMWFVVGRVPYVSIRAKLVALFILASVVPMTGLGFLGLRTPSDREASLRSALLQQGRDLISSIDGEFGAWLADDRAWYRRWRDHPGLASDPAAVYRLATASSSGRRLLRFDVRRLDGTVAFRQEDPGRLEGLELLFDALASLCVERNLGNSRLAELGGRRRRGVDPVLKTIFESPEMGYPFIIAAPDHPHQLQFAENRLILYFDVFRQPGHPLAYLNLVEDRNQAVDRYLAARLDRVDAVAGQGLLVFARSDHGDRWLPADRERPRQLESLADRVRIDEQWLTDRIRWRGETWWVLGGPGAAVQGCQLFALFPAGAITEAAASIRRGVWLGMGLALLLAMLTGAVLAETLLVPIGELGQGLQALRAGRADVRLPFHNQDELGQVAGMFNAMVADLKEMELARVVQEELSASLSLQCAGYDLAHLSVTCSHLGGDYADLGTTRDGRILLLVGDVTGHGVSAALIMALAKTVVFEWLRDGESLADLIERLNQTIFQVMRRKKMMTLFAGLLNPADGRLTYVNCGHGFPLVCHPDGTTRELAFVNFPLGSTERVRNLREAETEIPVAGWLVLYTDGIVEARGPGGEAFGYDRLANLLTAHRDRSAADLRQALRDDLQRHTGGPRFDDDVTAVLLRRTGIG